MIQLQQHPILPNVQMGYEERYLNCEVSGWTVRIEHQQHQTWVDGVMDDAAHIVLHIRMSKDGLRYDGSVTVADDKSGKNKINWFYKVNAERRRAVEFENIQPIVDEIVAYYVSPEGQKAMITQTVKAAQEELAALQAQIESLSNWISALNVEKAGIK